MHARMICLHFESFAARVDLSVILGFATRAEHASIDSDRLQSPPNPPREIATSCEGLRRKFMRTCVFLVALKAFAVP